MNRYINSKINRQTNNSIRRGRVVSYDVTQYPLIPLNPNDIYAITEFGDRLDNLANRFYGDVTLWWIISVANPNAIPFNSLFMPIGSQIRIPQNITPIIDSYNLLNR